MNTHKTDDDIGTIQVETCDADVGDDEDARIITARLAKLGEGIRSFLDGVSAMDEGDQEIVELKDLE